MCRRFWRNFRSGSAVDNLSDIAWEKWICDSVILFTENHDRENFQIPPEFLPIVRRLYDSFLQPTILRGFVDLINHIAPTVYRCFCFLVDVFELGMGTRFLAFKNLISWLENFRVKIGAIPCKIDSFTSVLPIWVFEWIIFYRFTWTSKVNNLLKFIER